MTAPALAGNLDLDRAFVLEPQVALRDEEFGALAYHYGTRRLVFLKSRGLVDLVRALEHHDTARAAIEATVEPKSRDRYAAALANLATSGVIHER
jgi:putative mycofactocin binding protein MftB